MLARRSATCLGCDDTLFLPFVLRSKSARLSALTVIAYGLQKGADGTSDISRGAEMCVMNSKEQAPPAIHPEDLLLGSAGVMDTYEWAKAIQQSKDLVRMLSDKDGDD